jgi:hypothetical protein
MLLDDLDFDFVRFEDVADEIDLYIEFGAQIPAKHEKHVHANGGRVVGYKFGNAFVLDAEKLIAGKGDQGIFNGTQFDAIWTNAQHMATNASYWEACYRAPVRCLPHVWEPLFAEKSKAELRRSLQFEYEPGRTAKRIAIYEPNINLVKLCHVPMLVCELAYRERPELIDSVWVTNTDRLRKQLTFQRFHHALDIGHKRAADGKHVCSCESRYNLVWFQAEHGDVVVTWQWENALNFVYYEALYGHYPLVHNSPLLPDGIGYRYHGFDAHGGARVLIDALERHDGRHEEYAADCDAFLRTIHPNAPANIDAHTEAIEQLWA